MSQLKAAKLNKRPFLSADKNSFIKQVIFHHFVILNLVLLVVKGCQLPVSTAGDIFIPFPSLYYHLLTVSIF